MKFIDYVTIHALIRPENVQQVVHRALAQTQIITTTKSVQEITKTLRCPTGFVAVSELSALIDVHLPALDCII